ncbi:MAG: anti-sigma factor family protein [Gemmatimonadales bacterium]
MTAGGTPLTCEEVFRRLDDYLDRELTEAEMERVTVHLETCAQCAQEHRFEARVIAEVKAKLGRINAPDLLVRRIATALEAERQSRQSGGPA